MTIKRDLEQAQLQVDEAKAAAKTILQDIETSGLSDEREQSLDDALEAAELADTNLTQAVERANNLQQRVDRLEAIQPQALVDPLRDVHASDIPSNVPPTARPREPAIAQRHFNLKNFKPHIGGQESAYRFGMWALDKISKDIPAFQGAFPGASRFSSEQFGASPLNVHMGGGADTSGAFSLVPEEFSNTLIRLREETGVCRKIFHVRPMASDSRLDPIRTSGISAFFVGQGQSGTESDAAYSSIRLTARKLMCLSRISSELSEDSVLSIADEIAGECAHGISTAEDTAGFLGEGDSTSGGIVGLCPKLATLTAGTDPGLILGSGNLWSELVLDDFTNMLGALPQYAESQTEAAWLCHKTFYYSVLVNLLLASGGVTASEVINGVPRPMFLGQPVIYSSVFPSTESNSQIPVTFGNYAMGCTFGDRRAETLSFSDQAYVNGESVFERDQIAVRVTSRFDINVHSIGDSSNAGPVVGLQTAAS